MPPEKGTGTKQVNVTLEQEWVQYLDTELTLKRYGKTKGEIVSHALQLLREGSAGETLVAGLQQQLSSLQSTLLTAVQTPAPTGDAAAVSKRLVDVSERLATMNTRLAGVDNELARVHSRLSALQAAPPPPPASGWWLRLGQWLGLTGPS